MAKQPGLCHLSVTTVLTPVTPSSSFFSFPAQLLLMLRMVRAGTGECRHPQHYPVCKAMEHLPSTTSAQRKHLGILWLLGPQLPKHLSLQTSQKPRDAAGQQQKAHGTKGGWRRGIWVYFITPVTASASSSPGL